MQGWRKNMEDAKITQPQVVVGSKTYSVFGVFDGHGGTAGSIQEPRCRSSQEVHFVPELIKNEDFKKGNIGAALEQNILC